MTLNEKSSLFSLFQSPWWCGERTSSYRISLVHSVLWMCFEFVVKWRDVLSFFMTEFNYLEKTVTELENTRMMLFTRRNRCHNSHITSLSLCWFQWNWGGRNIPQNFLGWINTVFPTCDVSVALGADPGLWAALRSQSKAPIQQIFKAPLRLLFAKSALTLRGTCECNRLLDREVLLGPRMACGWKQNRLGNLKIQRTKGVCSQQSFS